MTHEDVVSWFQEYPIKYKVEASENVVSFLMKCNCSKYLKVIPCEECKEKTQGVCTECQQRFESRTLRNIEKVKVYETVKTKKGKEKKVMKMHTKGICQNCHREQLIDCSLCNKKNVKRGIHECKRLENQHFTQRPTDIYPPIIKEKGAARGICPDCREEVDEKIYHRHQERRHFLVEPCAEYSRAFAMKKCLYCDKQHPDQDNITRHIRRHLTVRQFPCRHGCGQTFTQQSAENAHVKECHDSEGIELNGLRNFGTRRRLQERINIFSLSSSVMI